MRMWVHRVTIKEILDLRKPNDPIADATYECIGAWRLYEAIAAWLAGEHDKARAIAAKVRYDKFTDLDALLRLQERISTTYRANDPFTNACVAAHQQWHDWQKLINGHTPEQLERIIARHDRYRECQPELTTHKE